MRLITNRDRIVPTEEASRREARATYRREKRLRIAMTTKAWPELARTDLDFSRYWITHVPTGTRYREMVGEVSADPQSPVVAWFVDQSGGARFLEPA